MATGQSSSKRKSSSSHKKKSSKISSEVKRRRYRSRRKSKSKKPSHRDASLSYSEDDSRSEDSISFSSSDSEDDYGSRRNRSTTRKDEKRARKRIRKSSSSREDSRNFPSQRKKKSSKRSEDIQNSPSQKKKKSSKRKDKSPTRKKNHHKKRASGRSRREKSVDSVSSDSRCCSKPRGGSSSNEEREFERSRGRSEVREKQGKISTGKMRNRRNNCRSRSRSCSSFSGNGNEDRYCSEEIFSRENYSGRIRSVLIVANESNEVDERDYHKEENKAEIIQAYDDCPSCRSNDSYDGGRKKESSQYTHVISEKKRKIDDLKVEETCNSKTRTTEFEMRSTVHSSEGNDLESTLKHKALEKLGASTRIDRSEGDLESILRKRALEKFEASIGVDNSDVYNMESILRQRALENLKKFRGGLNTNVKTSGNECGDNVIKHPPITRLDDTTKIELHEEAGRVTGSKEMALQDTNLSGKPSIESKSATSKDDCQIPVKHHKQHESRIQPNATHVVLGAENPSLGQMVAGNATKNNSASAGVIVNKSAPGTCRIRKESSSDHSVVNQTSLSQKSPATKLTEPKLVDKNVAAHEDSSAHVVEISKTRESASPSPKASSCITPVNEKHGSNESEDSHIGSSQLEQKTMSVMRGGELVQVSYKVYIPKKPPALARRKLQR